MTTSPETQDCCDVRVAACCCGPDSPAFVRRYRTAEERQEAMGRYRDELKKELEGVEERIKDLESK